MAANPEWMATHLVQDFMSINWSGKEVKFLTSLEDFMDMLLVQRLPEFCPEPPVIDDEDFLAEETPFEVYVYFLAFRHNKLHTKEYLEFFKENFSSTSQSLVVLETKLKKREEILEAKKQDNGTEFLLSIFSPM